MFLFVSFSIRNVITLDISIISVITFGISIDISLIAEGLTTLRENLKSLHSIVVEFRL